MCIGECNSDSNIFSIAQMLAESWIDPIFVKLAGMGWFELVWFVSNWIQLEPFWFQLKIELVWFQFTSCPTFSALKIFVRSAFLEILLFYSFSSRFPLLVFIVPYHRNLLLNQSKMLQLLSLVLVISGHRIMMALDGFIPILLSAFRPKPNLFFCQFSNSWRVSHYHCVPVY